MKRKICVVTGSRADYGLLRSVMQGIRDDSDLVLQVVATGMHLSPTFGLTYSEIEADGFNIDYKVETLSSFDTAVGIAESMGNGLSGCAQAFSHLQPDVIVVLGDRFEIFAATAAALVAKIPVAHIHGGEKTIGAYDEAIRHAITKMSHLHFVAAEEYRKRVIQLGELERRVYLVGGLGVDRINNIDFLSRKEVEEKLSCRFSDRSLLVTYHPETLSEITSQKHFRELLTALEELSDTTLIFTSPNSDTGSLIILSMIEEFVRQHDNAFSFSSLGQDLYISCVNQVDGVIGNSSSGLLEVPSLKKGTINIGHRQEGRLTAGSVINCEPLYESIQSAISILYSPEFRRKLLTVENPYGSGGASERIVRVLREIPLAGLTKKFFNDIEFETRR
jgi:GDP/UDP-N,N'-diacetylbacillosamine 2-epimerase (hydrolysing)